MAESWRSSGRPTLRLNPKINQVKSMYYSDATEASELRKVDSFFRGLESCVAVLEERFWITADSKVFSSFYLAVVWW